MKEFYNRFRRFCAFVLGAVFFVSGLLKVLDPVGAGLVIDEYYKFLGIGFLSFSSEPVGMFLALAETFLGLAAMTGVWRKVTAVMVMILLALFTLLTVILVIFNPSMDCGCFGEAVHLTHLESLIKNIVLSALAAVAFLPLGTSGSPKKRKYVSFSLVSAAVAVFCIYSVLYIPVVDFTDFKADARLEASLDNSADVYQASFIYEKDGRQKRFCLENLPDSTWKYVGTETELVENQYETVVQLPLSDAQGVHYDEIAASGKVLAISVYKPFRLTEKRWHSVAGLVSSAYAAGFSPLVLVSGELGSVESWLWEILSHDEASMITGTMYFSDYKTLVTLNRSNGGAVFFSDGVLVRKWASRSLPDGEILSDGNYDNALEMAADVSSKGHLMFQAFLLYVFAVLLFI